MREETNSVQDGGKEATFEYTKLDADKVLQAFGKFGRYQMMAYCITNSIWIVFAAEMLVMAFITQTPDFSCSLPDDMEHVSRSLCLNMLPTAGEFQLNYTVLDQCKVETGNNGATETCKEAGGHYEFNDTYGTTLATEA